MKKHSRDEPPNLPSNKRTAGDQTPFTNRSGYQLPETPPSTLHFHLSSKSNTASNNDASDDTNAFHTDAYISGPNTPNTIGAAIVGNIAARIDGNSSTTDNIVSEGSSNNNTTKDTILTSSIALQTFTTEEKKISITALKMQMEQFYSQFVVKEGPRQVTCRCVICRVENNGMASPGDEHSDESCITNSHGCYSCSLKSFIDPSTGDFVAGSVKGNNHSRANCPFSNNLEVMLENGTMSKRLNLKSLAEIESFCIKCLMPYMGTALGGEDHPPICASALQSIVLRAFASVFKHRPQHVIVLYESIHGVVFPTSVKTWANFGYSKCSQIEKWLKTSQPHPANGHLLNIVIVAYVALRGY